MKLTPTQKNVIDSAKSIINLANNSTAFEFFKKIHPSGNDLMYAEVGTLEYMDAVNNIVSIRAKHETLEKLEKLGLIKIINIKYNKFQVL